MGKRKQVPRALHSEFSEYSSLLRALDAGDSLKDAKAITEEPPKKRRRLGLESTQSVAVAEPQLEPSKRERPRKRDTWTKWPLLVTDIRVPEFGLEEEIEALVRTCLQNTSHPKAEDADETDEQPSFLPHITQSASNFLSGVLALIAQHTPPRPQSLQERINPITWQTVLTALASCGEDSIIDATMIANVRARMEAIYGPCTSHTAERMQNRGAIRSRTAAALDKADDALLSFVTPQARQPKPKKNVVEDDVDSDNLDE
ncbi:hypothetical protein B0H11DRAFT_194566 [Mycena galericulata]|nr:hypothetical protein B0H11DRAFT_194566 [Mycena galericulata]